ncbi:MAG TPA: 1-deoxy-D-xylulose-5-phosphate synthase [Microthrixaceae bacterium]|nr:1-deoxy-D-xylulose-5-phosphate synthase [Microthrixaceae bacterium]MCB9402550.1 1-deoxy-D-xylulose-5-phosphate synthase [Microthrixaceae bacterium]MCO5306251.1 1-deoxy-D-xylulose-5-phosphate synthase [Microthrixaceae bacterium]HPG14690.1 1-deoxy-D-xylulose-5-phosphate synthase [Microthrixaceae bacterium]HRW41319.1 1-deoxy-D-xylulose-5-phosphate synthase [Microthrixaceae bacterium]
MEDHATTILDTISSPDDLAGLDESQLTQLATEIREFVVDTVNARGSGHLGSNLGVVELTIALHRVFHSPHDIIVWDTGHQAYVHKLLTGRQADFDRLREEGGLSGYPSRTESDHDWVENSHASTAVSYAHGLSTAMHQRGETDREVVAVIGDGALTGGMAYEGLNNLGHSGRKAIIVLNDNGRSYAPTASRLGESLSRFRASSTYLRNRERLERLIQDVPLVGNYLERGVGGAKAALREMFEPPVFFEQLGVHYLGPYDGHDVTAVETALRAARDLDEPVVVHVLTRKGLGYGPAEADQVKHMHDVGGVKDGSYTAAFSDAMMVEAAARPELVAITAAMPDSTGLLPVAARFPDRVLDVGIAEQHAVTSAAGMAMGGLRPVVALYSTFLTRAIDQVNLDVGLHSQPVVFALDRAGITGDDGPSHHGVLDMVLLSKVPDMTIFAPSSHAEVARMLHDALDLCTDGPAAIRYPKTMPPDPADPELGVCGEGLAARRLRAGSDVCLIGVGKMLAAARDAADRLAAEGHDVTLWDPRVVKPLDPEMLADAASHRLVITVEDGLRDGGIGAAIADSLSKLAPVDGPLVRVLGVPSVFLAQGKPDAILSRLGLDADGIADEALAWIRSADRTV